MTFGKANGMTHEKSNVPRILFVAVAYETRGYTWACISSSSILLAKNTSTTGATLRQQKGAAPYTNAISVQANVDYGFAMFLDRRF